MRKTIVCWSGVMLVLLAVSPASATPVWLTPVQLTPQGQSAKNPQIAIDHEGHSVALWEGPDNGVQAVLRPALGDAWQQPVVLSQGVGELNSLAVAVDSTGDKVVA